MMGLAMTKPGEGEKRLRTQRKKFWRLVGAGVGIGLVAGLVFGFMGGYAQDRAISPLLVWPALGLTIAVFVWYSAVYFRRIDELDLRDNLWASLIGLYVYLVALPAWYFLHDLNQLPPINHWAIYLTTFAAATIAYCVRKFR